MALRTSSDGQGSTERAFSHGRGGAGNIGKERRESFTSPTDLATPTLKSEHYTTGRGGSGNIAKNDPNHPEVARLAQDVEAPLKREPEGPHHYGRGGAANVAVVSEEEARVARENNAKVRGGSEERKSLLEKGKDILGLSKK
ncbi:hypothetical protein BU16DRAFT_524018 [Lophium mytilinum]|uniref:Uncharacterized protein n=1 Tax=Lophium mytilinum TaxID=390894 RepID=A0A6A6R6P1_9PEZI|nr:hypothetical protein BU16DRAFT_524018 [Lophium mytilinum]